MNKLLKISIFFVIFLVLFYSINFHVFLDGFKKLNLYYLIFTLFFSFFYLFIESIFFKKLISNQNVEVNIKKSFFLTCNTYLFNMVLPLSGMTWRAFYLKKNYNLKYAKYVKFLIQFLILEIFFSVFFLFLLYQIYFLEKINIYSIYGSLLIFFITLFFLKIFYVKFFKIKNFLTLAFCACLLILSYFLIVQSIFLSLGKNSIIESIFLSLILGISNYISITPGTYGIFEGTAVLSSLFIDMIKEEGLLIALLIRMSLIIIVLLNYFFSLKKKSY
jgi:uncharacterized membrane protein YbhN (UPF0104 family)